MRNTTCLTLHLWYPSLGLGSDDLVVEVASNDGSLLGCFRKQGVRTLGIEPARNIAAMARERGIDTIAEFFSSELARKVRAEHGAASAVIANNVLAHVDDTQDFLAGCRELISDEWPRNNRIPLPRRTA